MRSIKLMLGILLAIACSACSEGEDPVAIAGRRAELTSMTLSGTINAAPSGVTQEVLINGNSATVGAGTWTYTGAFDSSVTSVTVELVENGTVMATHELSIATSEIP